MKISIIVPAFNEEKLLARSLASIRSATGSFASLGWEGEIIVCDNNSSDRTAEIARAAGASVVFEPVNQISRARNRGASAATGDWLIFVDADSSPCPELFADVARQIRAGNCMGGGATVKLEPSRGWIALVTRGWNVISRLTHWAAGSFIYCEIGAFRQVGGFSEELFVTEELDFSKRLKQLARQRKKKVVILHHHPLITSPRKMSLYSPRELIRFAVQSVLQRGKTFKDRAACSPWYDGRR